MRLTAFACLMGFTPTVQALSFDLQSLTYQEDGFTRQQTFFPNDAQSRIYITLPPTWAVHAGGSTLALTNPAAPNNTIQLEKSSSTPDIPFKDSGLDAYRKRALAQVPNGSTEIHLFAEHLDPLPVFGWHDCEFVVDYDFYGQSFRRSVIFLDLNSKEQLVLTTLAPRSDFDRSHEVALDILRSWQVVPIH